MNTIDLLTMVSIDHNDPECKQAFAEFHRRYKQYVWNLSYKSAEAIDRNNAKRVAMIIAQNTFMKIHEKAGVFEKRSEDCDNDCRLWISGIVVNITRQYLQENNKHKEHIVFMEIVPDVEDPPKEDIESPLISIERKILMNALKTLSDKEKDVLLAWYNFYADGKVQNIPKDIKESLAKQYNLKVDSLKQTKKRALEKVLAYIDKNKPK